MLESTKNRPMLLPSLIKVALILLLVPTLHSLHSSVSCHSADSIPAQRIHPIQKWHQNHHHNRQEARPIFPDWFWRRRRSIKHSSCYNNVIRYETLFGDKANTRRIAFTPTPAIAKKEKQQPVLHQRYSIISLSGEKRMSHLFSSTRENLGHNSSSSNGSSQERINQTRNNLENPSRIKKVRSSIPSSSLSLSSSSLRRKNEMINPNHIAFICDGNSRWSIKNKSKFIPNSNGQYTKNITFWGHSNGASNVINLIKHIQKSYAHSINYVTMYAFSTENWSRDPGEIEALWNVLETFSKKFYDYVLQLGITVKIIGDLDDHRIPASLRELLRKLESDSCSSLKDDNEKGLTLCIAINYGGRKDIIDASLKMAELISRDEIILNNSNGEDVGDISNLEEIFSSLLCTSNIPDPDLVIRTGGECRMSNFLIWNCAYSEIYFTDTLWPDYSEEELDIAIEWYKNRERRFGGREQRK